MTSYKNGQLVFFFLLAGVTALLCFFIFKPFLPTLSVAAIFAVVLSPLHERLTNFLFGQRGVAAILLTVVMVALAVFVLSFLAVNIYHESSDFYRESRSGNIGSIGAVITDFEGRVNEFAPNFEVDVRSIGEKFFGWTTGHLAPLASSTANLFFKILLATVAIFFVLRDGPKLRRKLIALSPLSDQHDAEILSRLEVTINSVVRGSLLIATIQGTLVGLGFFAFGVPNAFLWGTVAAVAALIPGVGTSLVLVPGIIFLFFAGKTGNAIGLLIWGTVIVGLVDNFLAPYLYGRGSRVHPFLIFLSVIGGISAFGVAGFIFGPVLMSLAFTLADIYKLIVAKSAV